MAKAKSGSGKSEKIKDPEAPKGFDVSIGREKSIGWVSKTPGNTVTGRLISRHEYKRRSGKVGAYYQIELQESCLINVDNEDAEDVIDEATGEVVLPPPVKMDPGVIVNLDEPKAMEDLKKAIDMISRGAIVDVWTGFKGKEDNRSGEGQHWVIYPPKLRIVKQPTKSADF